MEWRRFGPIGIVIVVVMVTIKLIEHVIVLVEEIVIVSVIIVVVVVVIGIVSVIDIVIVTETEIVMQLRLTGVAANESMRSGKEVRIRDLVSGLESPDYPEMPEAFAPIPQDQLDAILMEQGKLTPAT